MSVGALITWPYKAGGRSRRGSPKAGTTVYHSTEIHISLSAYDGAKVKQFGCFTLLDTGT